MERYSRQRDAIFAAISAAGRPLSPQEVLAAGRGEVASLSIATVYRALKTLTEEKWIRAVELPGEPDRYEVTSLGEHHHFKCRSCGRVFDVFHDFDSRKLPAPPEFHVDRLDILLYGRCNECPGPSGGRTRSRA
ncbi:MAG: transcriptional repressor [Burkholderiales bacterium]|nr:transcriptional repressor [Burkholderiales bacterium]